MCASGRGARRALPDSMTASACWAANRVLFFLWAAESDTQDFRRHQALHAAKSQTNICLGCKKTFSRLDALNVSP